MTQFSLDRGGLKVDGQPYRRERVAKQPDPSDGLWDAYHKDPAPANLKVLVDHLGPTIDSAVSAYVGPQVAPTVRDRARLMAVDAIHRYRPDSGASLKTFVNRSLQGLQRSAYRITDPLPQSEGFRMDAGKIGSFSDSFTADAGREPTDEEVAEALSLPIKRVIKVRTGMRRRIPTSALEDADPEGEGGDVVGSVRTEQDDWVDAVYHDLGPVDRLIMMHRTGYRGADRLAVQDIAARLNISPSAVSQRARHIQDQLDRFR